MLDAITQEFYGSDGKVYVDYEAIKAVILKCNEILQAEVQDVTTHVRPLPELAMPRIGAGLAGGDWDIIAEIIEQFATHFKPIVYVTDESLVPKT